MLKLQQRHNLYNDSDLAAERQRGFRIRMDNIPPPSHKWKNNKAVRRRFLDRHTRNNGERLNTADAAMQRPLPIAVPFSCNPGTTTNHSTAPSEAGRPNMTYDNRLLVEE